MANRARAANLHLRGGKSIRASGRHQARARLAERLSKERSKGTKRAGGAAGKKAILRGQPARGVWAFGRKIGTRNGNVSRETVHRASIRAKDGWGWGATEKRQRPTFPCVGELSRLGKTFHAKRRAFGCRSQLLRARTRPSRGMPCLKAFHVKQTNKALPESFIKSGEFYKKRSVAAIFAQPGLGGRLVRADSCCCGAERVLLRSSGKATAFRSNRSCDTATLPRRRRQKQSAAVFAPERLFSGCPRRWRSLNRQTARQAKKHRNAGSGTPLRQKQRPRPVCLTKTLRIFRTFERRPTPRRRGSAGGGYRSLRLQSGERSVSAKRALPRRRGSAGSS